VEIGGGADDAVVVSLDLKPFVGSNILLSHDLV
jgi:hypothetical protein